MLAALALTAACGCMGWSAALRLTRRARALGELERALGRLEIGMLEKRLPLDRALTETGHALFEEAARRMDAAAAPGEALRGAAVRFSERGGALDCLTAADMTALYHLADELGTGGLQRQRLVLNEAKEEIANLAVQAAKRAAEMNRLYISLGALGGLTAAIILI